MLRTWNTPDDFNALKVEHKTWNIVEGVELMETQSLGDYSNEMANIKYFKAFE